MSIDIVVLNVYYVDSRYRYYLRSELGILLPESAIGRTPALPPGFAALL